MILVTAAEMRRLDALTIQRYGTPGHVLMERAGSGATRVLLEQFPHVRRKRVVVVAGKGNNGGDGFVIARLLRRKGVRAEVVLLGKATEVKGDAARMLKALRRTRVPVIEVATSKDVASAVGQDQGRGVAGRRDLRHRPQRAGGGPLRRGAASDECQRRARSSPSTSRRGSMRIAARRWASPSRRKPRRPSALRSSGR